jgi:ribosomal protein RSM22 (predicted rRNA methylase)
MKYVSTGGQIQYGSLEHIFLKDKDFVSAASKHRKPRAEGTQRQGCGWKANMQCTVPTRKTIGRILVNKYNRSRCSRLLSDVKELSSEFEEQDLQPHPVVYDHEYQGEPWKTLLEMSARASWRVSESPPPTELTNSIQKIVKDGGRTGKYLQRIHENTLAAQHQLMLRRERERKRVLDNMEYKPIDRKRDEGVKSVMYGPDEALAYFYYRCFPLYAVVTRVLRETDSLVCKGSWKPKRVLDFGVGCGSASAAALSVWKDHIEWIHGIDPSQTMRDGAQKFLDEFTQQLLQKDETDAKRLEKAPRMTFSAHPSSETASFDVVLMAYTAMELPQNNATLAAAAVLWEKLRPNGLFIMIEPGTPDGFSSVKMVRNMLLDCCRPYEEEDEDGNTVTVPVLEECQIIAPCTHGGPCPMKGYIRSRKEMRAEKLNENSENSNAEKEEEEEEAGDELNVGRKGFCSFVQSISGASGGNEEKFSYIVAQKRIVGQTPEPHPFDDVSVTDLLRRSVQSGTDEKGRTRNDIEETLIKGALSLNERFLNSDDDSLGLELLRSDSERQAFGRIIRAPIKNKGHVLIDCCVGPGTLVRSKVRKLMNTITPGLFSSARKSRWGGLWPVIEELKEDF